MAKRTAQLPDPLDVSGGNPPRRTKLRQAQQNQRSARAVDFLIGTALLALLSPLLLARALRSRYQSGAILVGTPLIGKDRIPFQRLSFSGTGRFRALAVWLNVVRGDLALVGPQPLRADEAMAIAADDPVRFSVRPGLISPFAIRSRIGLTHESESAIDRDRVYRRSLKGDLGLIARFLVSSMLSGDAETPREKPEIVNFFGVPVRNTTMREAIDWIVAHATDSQAKSLAFVNPDCLNIAWNNADYRAALVEADLVLPDGIGIRLGCRMRGIALQANVNGTDMFPLLCEAAARNRLPIYLLGARPGVARAAADNMAERFPELQIAGTQDGYFPPEEEERVVARINRSGARILLVAFGAPRQELWLRRWRERLTTSVNMGVGGLFDFYSGRIRRAPIWMREIGLEWVYRLIQEPGRMWRRYIIGNPLFLLRVRQQIRHPERFALATDSDARAGLGDTHKTTGDQHG